MTPAEIRAAFNGVNHQELAEASGLSPREIYDILMEPGTMVYIPLCVNHPRAGEMVYTRQRQGKSA